MADKVSLNLGPYFHFLSTVVSQAGYYPLKIEYNLMNKIILTGYLPLNFNMSRHFRSKTVFYT